MAETDYNEILLEAIDAIVVSRISEVNFDRTIVATIVDASKAKDGEYVLSDGSVQFTAHNSSDKYRENDRVNVLIPSNDFSSTEKTILGKTSANVNDVPVTYVSPLEKIVPMETNYAAGLKGGITANSETERFQLTNVEWITVNESTLGYDTLCVSARFKTLLNDYDIRQGHYGLLVQLKTKNGYIHALTLDSAKDMFGNPYGYSMYLTQEQTYPLNLQDNIIGIKIDLYQMKDFKYNDGINSELQVLPVMPYSNILVDNINVSFGYNAEQVEDNTVKISTADSLTYDNIKDASVTKKLTLTWYNKDENNKYLGFADGAFDTLLAAQTVGEKKYYIKWEHSLNNGQWEEVQETGQEQQLTVNLNMTWALNEYRAIVVFDGTAYTSNIIQFKNATGIDNPQEKLQMSLTLHNVEDSSYDSYPLYGPDGVIINPLDSSKNRKVYFSYESEIGGSLEPSVLNGATAYFYIPQNSTMLEAPGGETNWDDNQDKKHNKIGYTTYVKRFAEDLSEVTLEAKTFLYRVKKNYNPLFTNNSVILRIVDKNGFIYETSKTFAFSSYGTSGTDYSIIISGTNGENGWVGSNNFTPQAKLYDANYKEVINVAWTWLTYPGNDPIASNKVIAFTTTGYQSIKAQTTVSWVGKNVQISGIYPISYSSNENYMYQGPVTIIYNSNGVKPSYYDGNLGIFKKSDNSEIACTWSIEYFTKSNKDVNGDKKPWLSWGELTDTKDGHTRFKPSSMYLGDTYYLVLVAKSGTTILWRQPLIILQNQYASGLLNNWDGNLIVDNEDNYILSSMMGAGEKEDDNTFTGVLMGEVGKVDKSETGLFGYDHGVQSFGFKKDGTAFIGKSGVGRIEFDGSKGIIASSSWVDRGNIKTALDSNETGIKINLADGHLFIDAANNNHLYFNNDGLNIRVSDANLIIGEETVSAQIKASADQLTSTIDDTKNGLQSQINQKPDSISLSISDTKVGKNSGPRITLKYKDANGTEVTGGQGTITLDGDVVFTSSLQDNTTVISGGNIKTGALVIKDNNNTIFKADVDSGKVDIAGFTVDNNSIFSGTWTSNGPAATIFMSTGTNSKYYNICGVNQNNWVLGSGNKFGVDKNGALYSTSGKIGGWSIGENSLTNGIFGLYVDGGTLNTSYPFADSSAVVLKTSATVSSSIPAVSLSTAEKYTHEVGMVNASSKQFAVSFILPETGLVSSQSIDRTNDTWKQSVEIVNGQNCYVSSCTTPVVTRATGRVTCTVTLSENSPDGGFACQGFILHYLYFRTRKAVSYTLPAFAVNKNGFMACSSGNLGEHWIIQPDGLHSSKFYSKTLDNEFYNIVLTNEGVEERVYSSQNFTSFKRIARARSWDQIF